MWFGRVLSLFTVLLVGVQMTIQMLLLDARVF